jgi:hypothetical protein
VDTNLFTKKVEDDIFICQIYVDDIIFSSTNQDFCEEFGDMMSREFEMSMIGELSFFLCLQVKQTKDGTFICQSKYANDLLKRFGMDNSKRYRSMIDSLFYLTASRPDIIFSICMCAIFQASPKGVLYWSLSKS